MKHPDFRIGAAAILLAWLLPVAAQDTPPGAACATAHPLATEACLLLLEQGGNAFDAAVAASAALAVVEPTGSGLGGGGFWLLHRERDGLQVFVDGRETAPAAAGADFYLKPDGSVDALASRDGVRAAAIPGEPAALVHLAARYGRKPLAESLAPAIRYAREGFAVDTKLAAALLRHWPRFNAPAQSVFGMQGRALRTGERLQQSDLAAVLERLARGGRAGFYQGETARKLLAAQQTGGGVWTESDLLRYRVLERRPLITQFQAYRIITAPPPSAGGVALAQVFGQLESLGWRDDGSVGATHLLVETLRRAYRDRAAYLGDPDFVPVPVLNLTSRAYARRLAAGIDRTRATPSASLPPATPSTGGSDTTHFSVLDAEGNRVAGTLSINLPFGSAHMAAGTGILLNDEMDDFAASVSASNAYGLIGSAANAIAPGKRPLSSMTPAFVEGPRGLLILGTPGGSRIITMVLNGALRWMAGADVATTVAAPRIHHQYLPDEIQFEPGALTAPQQTALAAMGHTLKPLTEPYGNLQAVWWGKNANTLQAAADPRGVGTAQVVMKTRQGKN